MTRTTDLDAGTYRATARLLCVAVCATLLILIGCGEPERPLVNLDHLEHLGVEIRGDGQAMWAVRIYAEAPEYEPIPDSDEGFVCVDDAARAAVVYLRHFELAGDAHALERARGLIRFILHMQTEEGLFYNFAFLDPFAMNRDHVNSRADAFEWWAARAVWALGVCASTLRDADPDLAATCRAAVERTYPHLDALLASYPDMVEEEGYRLPTWLVHRYAADASSELLLGLTALQKSDPDSALAGRIARFAEGLAAMQAGTADVYPYGAFASWKGIWHAWGNGQAQALVESGMPEPVYVEADHFLPRLLLEGWFAEMDLSDSTQVRRFSQIAYGARTVTLGALAAYRASGDERYAVLAGLAASWFTGNNAAASAMYDADTGRGYDGINGPGDVNRNAGAESTVEALMTIQEIEQVPAARRWMFARAEAPEEDLAPEAGSRSRWFRSGNERVLLRLDPAGGPFQLEYEAP